MLVSLAHADPLRSSGTARKPIDYSRSHALSGQASGDSSPRSALDDLLSNRGLYPDSASDDDSASMSDDDVSTWLAQHQQIATVSSANPSGSAQSNVDPKLAARFATLVIDALGHIGIPYKYGGNSVESGGFDCSGFVKAVYHEALGAILPRRAEEQAAATAKIAREELRPGDLVFFKTTRRSFSHVGIYIGDDKFVHAPRTGARIRLDNITSNYWNRRFQGARRVEVAENQAAATPGQPGLRVSY